MDWIGFFPNISLHVKYVPCLHSSLPRNVLLLTFSLGDKAEEAARLNGFLSRKIPNPFLTLVLLTVQTRAAYATSWKPLSLSFLLSQWRWSCLPHRTVARVKTSKDFSISS